MDRRLIKAVVLVQPFRIGHAFPYRLLLRLRILPGSPLRSLLRFLFFLCPSEFFKRFFLRRGISAPARCVDLVLLFVQIVHLISDNVFTHYTGYFPFSQSHFREKRETCRFSFCAQAPVSPHKLHQNAPRALTAMRKEGLTVIVSPYELLCSCKPSPPRTTVTPYDLFSAVQAHAADAPAMPERVPEPAPASSPEPPILPPVHRTHYIAQINARHDQAQRQPSPPPRG